MFLTYLDQCCGGRAHVTSGKGSRTSPWTSSIVTTRLQRLDRRPIADAEEAIDNLVRGNKRYTTIVTQVHREILGGPAAQPIVIPSNPLSLGLRAVSGAAPAHAPFALVLGCSDARVPVEQVFDRSPGDLFVIRVAGNVLGVECLGSIDYAVANLGKSLKLVLVLGHSSCGAVTAAVESYLAPRNYAEIAFTHSLRSLVDRIQTAVRGAARACGSSTSAATASRGVLDIARRLVEAAVYLNTAITAYDVRARTEGLVRWQHARGLRRV